jgi:hypothetical protein
MDLDLQSESAPRRADSLRAWLMRHPRLWRGVLFLAAAAVAGCGNNLVTAGRSPVGILIEQFLAAAGNTPSDFANTLRSDVVVNVESTVAGQDLIIPTVYDDMGRVICRLRFKDPGTPQSPASPTSANYITVTRYRVVYRRADGRNTPGVDVPYPFDGGATFSILDIGSSTFTLVRSQAKLEPPLLALRGLGGAVAISTVTELTLYGHDQAGNEVSERAEILITFADFGDPQ